MYRVCAEEGSRVKTVSWEALISHRHAAHCFRRYRRCTGVFSWWQCSDLNNYSACNCVAATVVVIYGNTGSVDYSTYRSEKVCYVQNMAPDISKSSVLPLRSTDKEDGLKSTAENSDEESSECNLCLHPARSPRVCDLCRSSFCCAGHLLHHKAENGTCFPFKLVRVPGKGRGIVATRQGISGVIMHKLFRDCTVSQILDYFFPVSWCCGTNRSARAPQ